MYLVIGDIVVYDPFLTRFLSSSTIVLSIILHNHCRIVTEKQCVGQACELKGMELSMPQYLILLGSMI